MSEYFSFCFNQYFSISTFSCVFLLLFMYCTYQNKQQGLVSALKSQLLTEKHYRDKITGTDRCGQQHWNVLVFGQAIVQNISYWPLGVSMQVWQTKYINQHAQKWRGYSYQLLYELTGPLVNTIEPSLIAKAFQGQIVKHCVNNNTVYLCYNNPRTVPEYYAHNSMRK